MAGSLPGDPGRVPKLEPMLYEVKLGPYLIDRLPFPNDPTQPPTTGLTRPEASRACSEKGGRLCTELEWEFACKGAESATYATGTAWDAHCEDDFRLCASSFNVLGMGSALLEWTASDTSREGEASVRGATRGGPAPDHRCASRRSLAPNLSEPHLGFRCCRGAPNAAVLDEPALGTAFEQPALNAAELEALLKAEAETASLAKDILFFREPEAAETVVARGDGDRKGFLFTVRPLLWNPVAGARYLVVVARSGTETTFIVAYHVLDKQKYKLAASFVFKGEAGPIALAYSASIRPRLHFSSCWGCRGESGRILYRNPDRVVIVQP